MLFLLVQSFFWLFVLVLLVFVVLIGESRVLNYRLSQLSLDEKRAYYRKKINLFQLEKASNDPTDIKTATFLLRDGFEKNETVSVFCRGLKITNRPSWNKKIILYIHGAWSGLFQKHPFLNGYLSVDAVRGAISRFACLKLDVPVIAFQLPTEPTGSLNFGQEDDQLVLSIVIEKLMEMNPQVEISLYGVCVGALRIQRWIGGASEGQLKNIHTLILESPLPCVKRLVSFSKNDPVNEWMYFLFSLLLPSYTRHPEIRRFTSKKPTLLFGCQEDRLCEEKDLLFLQKQNFPNSKIIFVPEKWNHGELFKSDPFQQNVRALSNPISCPQSKQNKNLKND